MASDGLREFLASLGTAEGEHTGGDFLEHLQAVQAVLVEWGADLDVSRAGLFHSIYGTEGFQSFSLPLDQRETVRELIGERAEFIAYCNCVMDRASFDAAVGEALGAGDGFVVADRVGGPPISLSRTQLLDLAQVHLFDWLEQVERSVEHGWDYRREGYRNMAELLGPRAVEAYERVFAAEPKGAR